MPERQGRTWPTADPFSAVVAKPTALLGTLWATGGLLALLWAAFGVGDHGAPMVVAAWGAFASVLGAVLLARRTMLLARGIYVTLTLLGTVVICAILWWSGPTSTGAPEILFVYVGMFSCVALGRAAWTVIPASAAIHALMLAFQPGQGGLGEWLVVWGATVVASVLLGVAVDANRRVTAEREQLLEDLRAGDETKTAFLQALGHDLSAPAAHLATLARTLIERGPGLSVRQRDELLERLEVNAIRLHGDLNALLRLEELGIGRLPVNLEPVGLEAVTDRAIERSAVPHARLERDSMRGLVVFADATKLEHALANLLSNAAKYGAEGGRIRIGAIHEEDRTIVHVDDDGPGVPEAERERIFEPLGRARIADVEHGSGIGLSVVRAFAHFHGGEAWVEDAPGHGARFCIALPHVDPLARFAPRP